LDPKRVIDSVRTLTEPLLGQRGLELFDVQFRSEHGRMVLRLFIDFPAGGVTLDQLADMSRQLGDVLDAHEAVPTRHQLECSSPGVERPLRRREHFERAVGGDIRLTTHEPRDGRRRFRGVLEALTAEGIRMVDADVGPVELLFDQIADARTEFDARRAFRARARS